MPAVHEIISTLNQFAQARLPAAGWRGGSFDATRFYSGGLDEIAAGRARGSRGSGERLCARRHRKPPLEEVLSDPVVQLIMQADHLEPAEVRRLLAAVRRQRHRGAATDPGAICPQ